MTYSHVGYLARSRAAIASIRADLEREVREFAFTKEPAATSFDMSPPSILVSQPQLLTEFQAEFVEPQPKKRRRKKK